MTSSTTGTPSEKRTCPCKNLPWSLSSFTAAEFGDVHSLIHRNYKRPYSSGITTPDVWNRPDEAGYTPLHLAAQHNHVAATSLLLKLGADVNGEIVDASSENNSGTNDHPVDGGDSAAATNSATRKRNQSSTPLHRAAFSGATATIRLLIQEKNCNLLAQDTSFGDLKTPLHKASAGGRYLAIQLLLEELSARRQLQVALQAKDSSSRTPLQVAQEICPRQEHERESVARWDAVAGGVADWTKCIALLLRAADETDEKLQRGDETSTSSAADQTTVILGERSKNPMCDDLPPPPLHLSSIDGCLDCEQVGGGKGMCLTSSWQAAFQAALGKAVDLSISRHQLINGEHNNTLPLRDTGPANESAVKEQSLQLKRSADSSSTNPPALSVGGIACKMCGKQTISLYPTAEGRLVCKTCHRRIILANSNIL